MFKTIKLAYAYGYFFQKKFLSLSLYLRKIINTYTIKLNNEL